MNRTAELKVLPVIITYTRHMPVPNFITKYRKYSKYKEYHDTFRHTWVLVSLS